MKSEPLKSNRVLQVILAAFLIIAFRVWHLEVVQRDEKLKLAERPKKRVIVQKADRGTICDRFNIPLAVNKICYNAALYYNQISQIPAVSWKTGEGDKRVRCHPRREYIKTLADKLGAVLHLDPRRVEDLIHSKASLFPHVPFLLKSHLSEEEHYQLALLEKDWPGVHAEIASERFYPKGRVGAGIIGCMGSISSKEYVSIADEIGTLQRMVDEWEQGQDYSLPAGYASFDSAVKRLQELKEKAYTIQDLVGKSGIEGQFEQLLRGFYGKKIFEVDQQGKCLRELSGGKREIPGQQLGLTLSIELQEFAEALLTQDEALREGKSLGTDPKTKERKALKQPWIKGGSIVALDPNTGEILALASIPRFDPNDFIPGGQKQRAISRWLENDRFIASIWDGKQEMVRERFSPEKGFYEESAPLTWDRFLESLMPLEEAWKQFFHRVDDVKTAVQVQEDVEALLYHSKIRDAQELFDKLYAGSLADEFCQKGSEALSAFKRLDALLGSFASNGDRLLAIDLCRLVVHAPAISDESLKILGSIKLHRYRALNQAVCRLETTLKEQAQQTFHTSEFQVWREANQKTFLAEKSKEEKKNGLLSHPYLDYLDQKESELFEESWKERRLDILASAIDTQSELQSLCKSLSREATKAVLHTFRSFSELQRPLLGSYRLLRKKKGEQTEKELAMGFYPIEGFGHSRSYAFQASGPQGSVFKLVTAYAALAQTNGTNPLTLVDEVKNNPTLTVATNLSGMPYPRMYKGGRLPRSHVTHIGKIDLIGALEQSSNSYFSILSSDILQEPEDLNRAAKLFGFGAKTGIDLIGEVPGHLPTDLSRNKTGLYSMAIGHHTLLTTPLQTARLLASIANGGKLLKPTLVKKVTGPLPDPEPLTAFESTDMQDELRCLGLSFPLFTASCSRSEKPISKIEEPQLIRTIDFPKTSRMQLLHGMDLAVWSNQGSARASVIKKLRINPSLLASYLALRHEMIGKTGTAEILFNPYINPSSTPQMYKHIWFGSIAFDSSRWEHPELVVVVYLRYGDAGKEAAPLAAQMIRKWRELKKLHSGKEKRD